MKRQDIHRPSAIVPSDYDYVGLTCVGQINSMDQVHEVNHNRELIRKHMEITGGKYSGHAHGGNCYVCGAVSGILVVYWHRSTNMYIKVGHICADKMDMSYDDAEYNLFQKAVREQEQLVKGMTGAKRDLDAKGMGAAFELYMKFRNDRATLWQQPREEQTVFDIADKLVRYGSLSESQYNYVGKLLHAIEHRAEIAEKKEIEMANVPDVPEGRLQITGEVLSIKVQDRDETAFPGIKMLVKTEQGFKLWGTLPAAIIDADRGCKVQFTATVKRSDKDSKFGFFNRPTKAVRLS